MNKYVNEMEDYLYNHNYISENNNDIKQKELSVERASCIVQKYRTLTEEKDKEIERLKVQLNGCDELLDNDEAMIDKYKLRIDKAIEYIEENKVDLSWFIATDEDFKTEGISNVVSTFRLLEILKGDK